VPVATPEPIEHVEEDIKRAPFGFVSDVTLQVLSVKVSPVAVNVMVSPGDPLAGVSVKYGATGAETVKVRDALSPSEPVTFTV